MTGYLGFEPSLSKQFYFVSYNSEDTDRIAPILASAHSKGLPMWYDKGLRFDQSTWEAQIADKIDNCTAVIMFITRGILEKSNSSFVHKEYRLAREFSDKPVCPVFLDRIENREIPIAMRSWWIDLTSYHGVMAFRFSNAQDTANALITELGFSAQDIVYAAAEPEQSEDPKELNKIGDDYYFGRGVEKDYSKACEYYRRAAELGYADAQNNLGIMYRNGWGVAPDYAEALKWYRKGAEQGNAAAQNSLGVMYRYGYGVNVDYAEAVKWYRKSAEQGCSAAQNNLGVMYGNGYGVNVDYSEAVKWYSKSAEQGFYIAQYNLAYMYEKGQGVAQNKGTALMWYKKAAAQGDEDAKKKAAELEAAISH